MSAARITSKRTYVNICNFSYVSMLATHQRTKVPFSQIGEDKTVFKGNSKKNLSMDHQSTIKKKYSFKDAQERHASETAKTRQNREKKYQICLYSLAHFLLYNQDNPQILEKSIKYLFELSQRYPKPKSSMSIFSLQAIQIHLKEPQSLRFLSFFRKSIKFLNNEVLKFVKQFRCPQLGINTQVDAKLEVVAYFWEFQKELKQYLPTEDRIFRKIQALALLFDMKTLSGLRKFYYKYEDSIICNVKELGIQELVSTYFILLLKMKFLQLKMNSKISEAKLKDYQKYMQQIAARKKSTRKNTQEDRVRIKKSFSKLYLEKTKGKINKGSQLKPEDVDEVVRVFQYFIYSKEQPYISHPSIIRLEKQKKIRTAKSLINMYQRYKKEKKRQQNLQEEDIRALKIQLLTRYIRRNSQLSFEDIKLKIFKRYHVFIDRHFYEENIVDVLKKENQYHQLVYINRVIQDIEEQKRQGEQIIFANYYNYASDDQAMKDESKECSIIVAVGLNGSLSCKVYKENIREGVFIREIDRMFGKIDKKSVFVFYDRKFPHSKWLKQEEINFLRKYNIVTSLPVIEAVPNPCQKVYQHICKTMKETMEEPWQEKSSLEDIFEEAVKFCQGKNVISQILKKQWDKINEITFKEVRPLIMYDQQPLKKEENWQEHFDEQSPKNVQRKFFAQEKDVSQLSEDINAEKFQASCPIDNQVQQSDKSNRFLNEIRNIFLRNSIFTDKHLTSSTKLKEEISNSSEDSESPMPASSEYLENDKSRKKGYQLKESIVNYIRDHENKQIPIMENIESMKQEQLRRFLSIITSNHYLKKLNLFVFKISR